MSEKLYLDLLDRVLIQGERRTNRTGIDTLSVYGPQLEFDLSNGFPLFTTKRVWFKGVAVELDWMLQGLSNVAYLQENGVKIWDAWAKADYRSEMGYAEGELGPVYGHQWRHWRREPDVDDDGRPLYNDGIDQIAMIVDKLRFHRDDRRIILSSWNVDDIDKMKLPPCHYAAQFLVDNSGGLTCIVSIRSWDLFLGAPFNVAQYALLTHVLAHVSGLHPRRLVMNAGDAHIYVNHLDQVREQIDRAPKPSPSLVISSEVKSIDDFRWHHARLSSYVHHDALPGEVAV